MAGRRALRVELTHAITLEEMPDVDFIDMPTFVSIPVAFENGTIEVDILSRLTARARPTPAPQEDTNS